MIVEYIRYNIQEDHAAPFTKAYQLAAPTLSASPHCLAFELSRCAEDASQFVLRIEWDSAEGHLQGFRQSPQFAPFLAAVKPFVGDVEEMRHYELTAVRWRRSPS